MSRFAIAAAVLFGTGVFAADAAAQDADLFMRTVAVDELNVAAAYYDYIERAKAQNAWVDEQRQAIRAKLDERDVLRQRRDQGALILSDANKASLDAQIDRLNIEIPRMTRDLEDRARRRSQDHREEMAKAIEPAVQAEAEARSADLIIYLDRANEEIHVVSNNLPDITMVVAAKLNAPCNADAACRARHPGLPGIGN